MSRRWIVVAALLCPACARGSGPPDDAQTVSVSVDTPSDPAPPTKGDEGSGGASDSGDVGGSGPAPGGSSDTPPAGGGEAAGGSHAGGSSDTPPPGGGQAGGSSGTSSSSHLDCEALWEVADHVGCSLVKLLCVVLDAVQIESAQIPCDIAVPITCGLSSAAADAAEALCPR